MNLLFINDECYEVLLVVSFPVCVLRLNNVCGSLISFLFNSFRTTVELCGREETDPHTEPVSGPVHCWFWSFRGIY